MDNDPWKIMDDWCKRQSEKLGEQGDAMLSNGTPPMNPAYRTLLGKSQAFGRVRAFIHGARQAR